MPQALNHVGLKSIVFGEEVDFCSEGDYVLVDSDARGVEIGEGEKVWLIDNKDWSHDSRYIPKEEDVYQRNSVTRMEQLTEERAKNPRSSDSIFDKATPRTRYCL